MLWMNLALLLVQTTHLSSWMRLRWYAVPLVAMASIVAYGFMGGIQHLALAREVWPDVMQ
ncbi:MAG: hypothetical protein BWZ07_02158 [Alphaproteobacteria bacterium ADurb.BinA280]|jgi:hypothetical protein|nr:MAG: hypothetical protein BWZ07_02158 [Alphaproteobacteria bacterium ADurb.BinA280]